MTSPDPLRSLQETAAQLDVGYSTLRRYISNGELDVVRYNRSNVKVRQSVIDAFLAKRLVPATAA